MNSQSNEQSRQWAMFLHLSQLANFVIPLAGVIAPIIMWQTKKDVFADIDAHGKVVVNWLISSFIYSIGFAILSIILIGIPLLIALGVLAVGFPIYGAIKANDGEVWSYPLSIKFIK